MVPQAIFKSSKPPFFAKGHLLSEGSITNKGVLPALLSEEPDTMATFMSWTGLGKRYSVKAGALYILRAAIRQRAIIERFDEKLNFCGVKVNKNE